MLRRGADELDAMLGEDVCKARILRQEAVARMHGLCAGDLAGGDDRRNVEVTVTRGRRPDANAFVGEAYMHGVGVRRRVDGDGLNAEFAAGAQDAQRDFTPVGDEDLVEHRPYSIATSGSPYSTGWALSTKILVILPERGAWIWFIVFIASMMRSVWPSFTVAPTSMKFAAPGEGAM